MPYFLPPPEPPFDELPFEERPLEELPFDELRDEPLDTFLEEEPLDTFLEEELLDTFLEEELLEGLNLLLADAVPLLRTLLLLTLPELDELLEPAVALVLLTRLVVLPLDDDERVPLLRRLLLRVPVDDEALVLVLVFDLLALVPLVALPAELVVRVATDAVDVLLVELLTRSPELVYVTVRVGVSVPLVVEVELPVVEPPVFPAVVAEPLFTDVFLDVVCLVPVAVALPVVEVAFVDVPLPPRFPPVVEPPLLAVPPLLAEPALLFHPLRPPLSYSVLMPCPPLLRAWPYERPLYQLLPPFFAQEWPPRYDR